MDTPEDFKKALAEQAATYDRVMHWDIFVSGANWAFAWADNEHLITRKDFSEAMQEKYQAESDREDLMRELKNLLDSTEFRNHPSSCNCRGCKVWDRCFRVVTLIEDREEVPAKS